MEDEGSGDVLDRDLLPGEPFREVVVELVRELDVALRRLDDAAEDVRLVVVELAAVALDRDALEVAVADGDAALVFGVLLAGVEDRVGLELQPLSLLQLDDRDVLVGDLDERVAALDVAGVRRRRAFDVEREGDLVADLEVVERRRQGDEPQTQTDHLVEHDRGVLDEPDGVDRERRDVGDHRAADAVGERRREPADQHPRAAFVPFDVLDVEFVFGHVRLACSSAPSSRRAGSA